MLYRTEISVSLATKNDYTIFKISVELTVNASSSLTRYKPLKRAEVFPLCVARVQIASLTLSYLKDSNNNCTNENDGRK